MYRVASTQKYVKGMIDSFDAPALNTVRNEALCYHLKHKRSDESCTQLRDHFKK